MSDDEFRNIRLRQLEITFEEMWARRDAEYDRRMAEFPDYKPGPRQRRKSGGTFALIASTGWSDATGTAV